jgi:hypothetical protein
LLVFRTHFNDLIGFPTMTAANASLLLATRTPSLGISPELKHGSIFANDDVPETIGAVSPPGEDSI